MRPVNVVGIPVHCKEETGIVALFLVTYRLCPIECMQDPIVYNDSPLQRGEVMRSILLWLLGVPIPIIILLALFWH